MLTAIHMKSKTQTGTPVKRVTLFSVAFVLCVADTSFASDNNDFGPWGYDLTARDTSVKPGDDFFEHANGAYLKRTVIPDDQSSTGGGRDVHNSTQEQLRTLIESSAAHPKPGVSRQIGDMFKSFMDESRVEQFDASPLKADIARGIGRIKPLPDRSQPCHPLPSGRLEGDGPANRPCRPPPAGVA